MFVPHMEIAHSYCEIIDQVYASRPGLNEQPLQNSDGILFLDGSSFMRDRVNYTGHAIVSQYAIVEAQALPPGISTQLAK